MLLLNDKDVLKYNERMKQKIDRIESGKASSVFEALYEQRKKSQERMDSLKIQINTDQDQKFRDNHTFRPELISRVR